MQDIYGARIFGAPIIILQSVLTMIPRRNFAVILTALILSAKHLCCAEECSRRYYDYDSFVCVCNATYCDHVNSLSSTESGNYAVYTTSRDKYRLSKSQGQLRLFHKEPNKYYLILENANFHRQFRCSGFFVGASLCVDFKEHQTIVGFGGSFTDAAGINIYSLSAMTRQNLMDSYFSGFGLEYNLGRVPIGGADFSTRAYSYADNNLNDFNLSRFSLQEEDYKYKIPLIKEAQKMISTKLNLVASAWSAPTWMKTNGHINKGGFLKGKPGGLYYQTWADYFVRFLQEYEANNVSFWAITTQNEPIDGFLPFFPFNSMGFTPNMQRIFVNHNLGPTLENNGYGNIKIFVLDDSRPFLLPYMGKIMLDPLSKKYVSGAALHWYFDKLAPPEVLDLVHYLYPNKMLLMTEVSFLHWIPISKPVQLGNWNRAESYAQNMIQNLNHWVAGWIDWNLALDLTGGPNWAKFYLEGTIIVNKTGDEFYKQPIFYIIGHFSKFIPHGSRRISIHPSWKWSLKGLFSIAFVTPNSTVVVVVLNSSDADVPADIFVHGIGQLQVSVPKKSIQTYIIPIS